MKTVWKAVLTGVLVVCLWGCNGGGSTNTKEGNESDAIVTESQTETEKTTERSKAKGKDGIWVDLGFDGEVNVNACPDLAKNWWESSNGIYVPLEYPGKENKELEYCYLYWRTYEDIMDVEPPKELEGLPEFFYEKKSGWSTLFESSVALGMYVWEQAQMDIDKQERVTINGEEFLRVEGTVHAIDKKTGEDRKSQKYIAYYGLLVPQEEKIVYKGNDKIPAENAQTVLIMGDTTETQDRFDDVCAVADAIMGSYRLKEK